MNNAVPENILEIINRTRNTTTKFRSPACQAFEGPECKLIHADFKCLHLILKTLCAKAKILMNQDRHKKHLFNWDYVITTCFQFYKQNLSSPHLQVAFLSRISSWNRQNKAIWVVVSSNSQAYAEPFFRKLKEPNEDFLTTPPEKAHLSGKAFLQ